MGGDLKFGIFAVTSFLNGPEKPAQNSGVCENQGKQRKLSDDWKSIKTVSLHPAKSNISL